MIKETMEEAKLDVKTIFDTLKKTHIENQFRRNAYALALIEASSVGIRSQHLLFKTDEEKSCVSCCDEIKVGEILVKYSTSCEYDFCMDCARKSLENLSRNNTCLGSCQCHVHSDFALSINTSLQVFQKIQQINVSLETEKIPDWRVCEEPDCVGGFEKTDTTGNVVGTQETTQEAIKYGCYLCNTQNKKTAKCDGVRLSEEINW